MNYPTTKTDVMRLLRKWSQLYVYDGLPSSKQLQILREQIDILRKEFENSEPFKSLSTKRSEVHKENLKEVEELRKRFRRIGARVLAGGVDNKIVKELIQLIDICNPKDA